MFNQAWLKKFFLSRAGVFTVATVLLLVIALIWSLGKAQNSAERFVAQGGVIRMHLVPQASDVNGLDKGVGFILKTNHGISAETVKNNLRFSPALDYDVKERSLSVLPFIKSVLADSQTASMTNEYEIIPKTPLEEGETYVVKTATSSEIVFDHDYSWAFKVKEDFDISESLPSDKSVGAPVNTGIEISFNRFDIAADAGKYFVIEPAVKGDIKVESNKIVFVPNGNLKEKTLYTITIKKGFVSGEKSEVLNEDKSFSFETSAKDTNKPQPYLYLSSPYSELTSEKDALFEAYGDATSSEMIVYKYAQAQDFLDDYYAYRYRDYQWSQFNKEKFLPNTKAQQVFKFRPELLKKDENNNFGLIKLPQALDTGFYVLKLTTGKTAEYNFARVSPLAYYYSEVNGDGLIWTYDFVNKKPFADVKVSFKDETGKVKEAGTTDKDGLLKFDSSSDKERQELFKIRPRDEGAGHTTMIFTGAGLDTAVPDVGRMFEKKKNYFQGYLNTDRYAYRLTDKVHFWGVIKGRSFDLREKKVKVSLSGLVETEVTVSPFDTIEGELDFTGMNSGWQSLTVTYNDELIVQSGIEVFSFEKPLYKIELTTEKSFAVVDKPVKVKTKVSFFDGTPVSNMELNYEINWKSEKSGKIKTNAKGEAELNFTPEYYFEQGDDDYSDWWTSYPMNLRFTVRPALSEEGEIWGESNVSVYGPNITMSAEQKNEDKAIIFRAKVNELNLATSSEDGIIGASARGQVLKVEIFKHYYEKIEDGETYDPVEKVKTKNYRYEMRKKLLKEASGATDEKGEWSISIDAPSVNDYGFVKAIFSTQDRSGKKVLSSADSYNYYPNDNTALNLSNIDIGKKANAYKIGEDAHLKLELTGKQKSLENRALLIRYQEGLRRVELIDQNLITDKFSEQHVPSMSYMAVRVMPSGFLQSNDVTVLFDAEEKRLDIDINPEKEKYRPGEKVNLNINIKNKDKNGIKAVANVAAVDEALFNVTPWGYGGEILSSLYTSISSYPNSLSTSYVTDFKAGAEFGGCFVGGTTVMMGDGSVKDIADVRVGDEVKTFVNDESPTQGKSIVQGVSSHAVNGYLLINKKLKVTPEHKIFVNGAWKMAGQAKVDDYLVRSDRQAQAIATIEFVKARDVKVYNIIVGRYHTYFADGFFVHNAEKGGGGDTRNFFQDTPLYKQLESDDKGIIRTSFKAPDNLTSWRVSVNAYDRDGMRAGSADKLVPVGLPLFVDAIISKQYLAGDNPVLKVRAFGAEYKAKQKTEFSVMSDSLKLDFATTTNAGEINISLGGLTIGKHKIKVAIQQGEMKDALEKEFTVYENFVTHHKSDSQSIVNGRMNLKSTVGSFTDLLFMDDGKGKYYNELLSLNWSGSIRSDIQAAAYLAGKTLNESFYGGKQQFGDELDLSNFQNYNNAYNVITLFPYSAADFLLTAELADAMPDKFSNMSVIEGLQMKIQDQQANLVEISESLYALASLGKADLPFTNYLRNNASTTLEAKVYLALALYKAGDAEGARSLYSEQILPKLKIDETNASLEVGKDKTKNIKTTAVLGILASYLEPADSEVVVKILVYLKNNSPKDDSTALENAIIIRNEIFKREGSEASFSYATKSHQGKVDLSEGQSFSLTLSEEELKTLVFSDVVGKSRAVAYYEEAADSADLRKSQKVSVTRKYLVNGKEVTDFKDGDLVTVRIDAQFAKDAPDDIYQLVDYLPSGLKPVVREYDLDVQSDGSCDTIWYPVKRTDTAIYFNFGKWFEKSDTCKNRTLNYRARVTTKGVFKAQGTVLQSMNNLEIINSGKESLVEIK